MRARRASTARRALTALVHRPRVRVRAPPCGVRISALVLPNTLPLLLLPLLQAWIRARGERWRGGIEMRWRRCVIARVPPVGGVPLARMGEH